jgi:hypothetical protein
VEPDVLLYQGVKAHAFDEADAAAELRRRSLAQNVAFDKG